MLWLNITFPQLPLEALGVAECGKATVVTACEGNARWVICRNLAAERANLSVGVNVATTLAIHPDVVLLDRKPNAESAALQRLAAWAYQFSGSVIVGEISDRPSHAQTTCLWLEIGASLKLFGGFRNLIEQLERELQELRYTYQLGVGPTFEGAALLARAGVRIACTSPQALFARIRDLPLTRLLLDADIIRLMHSAGVRSIGLLTELPRDQVARRFGPELSDFLARLMGESPDPRPAYRLPDRYDAHFEFEFELRSTESLLFPLRRMLREFAGFLRARDTGVQRFTLTLSHRDIESTQLRIGLSAPDRDAERFFSLVREQLERVELPAPTIELRLAANEFSSPTALQSDLLTHAAQQTEELAHTIDRIVSRLGDEQVHRLTTVADHRPEAAWATREFDITRRNKSVDTQFFERPLWLLPEPKPLQFSATPQGQGPERIEGGWWDSADVQRDYYVVRTSNGADLWVYRDLSAGGWYLHGFWS